MPVGEDQASGVTALPLRGEALAFTMALTPAEYLSQDTCAGRAIHSRLQEVRLLPEDQHFFNAYPDVLHWIALVSEDTPDTAIVLPIWMRLAQCSPRIDLRIWRDTDDLSLLAPLVDDLDLTEDLADVELPLLLLFDEEWQYQDRWGPHPQAAEPYLEAWLERHPEYETLAEDESAEAQDAYGHLLDCLTWEMRVWYNSGLNHACVAEIRSLLESWQSTAEEEGEDGTAEDPSG
ncbi:thioredoxin family protein [Litorilinea aerophila]|nr:thioredoxin family protein [Litorilinea aerophila]MCC9075446.1 thioredoxin family protein [Litorilinea aerophila]OUC07243.1 hypothetical protein RY27_16020 [Litorilinea aerophila]GIV76328.1 MAG: hypothetical protein KatS3mg050_0722 [Litorilinea sp.]